MEKQPEMIADFLVAVKSDEDSLRQLRYILKQSPFNRKSLLNSMVSQMKLQKAAADDIESILALTDDRLAELALKALD